MFQKSHNVNKKIRRLLAGTSLSALVLCASIGMHAASVEDLENELSSRRSRTEGLRTEEQTAREQLRAAQEAKTAAKRARKQGEKDQKALEKELAKARKEAARQEQEKAKVEENLKQTEKEAEHFKSSTPGLSEKSRDHASDLIQKVKQALERLRGLKPGGGKLAQAMSQAKSGGSGALGRIRECLSDLKSSASRIIAEKKGARELERQKDQLYQEAKKEVKSRYKEERQKLREAHGRGPTKSQRLKKFFKRGGG